MVLKLLLFFLLIAKEDPNYDPPPYTPQEGATPLQDMAPKPYSATDPVVVHPTAETFGTAFAPVREHLFIELTSTVYKLLLIAGD